MIWTILRSTGPVCCAMSLNRDLYDVCLMATLGLWFVSGKNCRGKVSLLLHIKGITADVDPGHPAEVAFVKFLHCRLFLPFPHCIHREKSLCTAQEWEMTFYFLEVGVSTYSIWNSAMYQVFKHIKRNGNVQFKKECTFILSAE